MPRATTTAHTRCHRGRNAERADIPNERGNFNECHTKATACDDAGQFRHHLGADSVVSFTNHICMGKIMSHFYARRGIRRGLFLATVTAALWCCWALLYWQGVFVVDATARSDSPKTSNFADCRCLSPREQFTHNQNQAAPWCTPCQEHLFAMGDHHSANHKP